MSINVMRDRPAVRRLTAVTFVVLVTALTARTQTTPDTQGGNSRSTLPLEKTYWKATELGGKPVPGVDSTREAHLVFEAEGRVTGSDGCNRVTGSYRLTGEAIKFGQMAATQMACPGGGETERAFHAALGDATRYRIVATRLELYGAADARVARFDARVNGGSAQPPAQSAATNLGGTSWQLVKFRGSDDTTLTPEDRTKYTFEFGADGGLSARIDCDRGRGTWKSASVNQLQFGPLALTRAMCPPGSLHDRIVKDWNFVRSYVIKDGHLFLSLMADGGIYEFEPTSPGHFL